MDAGKIVDSLTGEIKALESLRGFILWNRAPVALADAVQIALDNLNEAAEIAEKWIEQEKENLPMKEFFELLGAFKASEESVKGAKERVAQLGAVCDQFNVGFDKFKECAEGFAGVFDSAEGGDATGGEGDAAGDAGVAEAQEQTV